MSKINKALDLNKLFEQQEQGKLLKKHLEFPVIASIKYDGNYTVVEVSGGNTRYVTSGGHEYKPNDDWPPFENLPNGAYFCERIGTDGKLGDRVNCSLTGPEGAKVAKGHKYKIFDYVTISDYLVGESIVPYVARMQWLEANVNEVYLVKNLFLYSQAEVDKHLQEVVNKGYEGLMLKDPMWLWKDTKSRTVQLVKYKKRRTADLICVATIGGQGKYEGMIGSLILEDSDGRQVQVGSGLSDMDRDVNPLWFHGKVVEIEFEQVIDTYIQPTFICVREDKPMEDID